jgi:hypothetical protein
MKITLREHGGLAAGIKRSATVIDTDTLPKAEAAAADALLARAKEDAVVAEQPARRVPDAMSYTIEIEADGRALKLSGSDTNMNPGFAALKEWIERHK